MKRQPVLDEDNGFAEHGGYMAAKVTKLEEQFTTIQANCRQKSSVKFQLIIHCANRNLCFNFQIFEGVSIFVNGYTNPNAEELKRIMMEHGGEYLTK